MCNVLIFIRCYSFNCNWWWVYFLMIVRKLFLILCNRCMRVILYKLHFLSPHFSSQPNKWVFRFSTFPSSQPNTNERKLNLFYSPNFSSLPHFLSSHFFTLSTKWGRTIQSGFRLIRSDRTAWFGFETMVKTSLQC